MKKRIIVFGLIFLIIIFNIIITVIYFKNNNKPTEEPEVPEVVEEDTIDYDYIYSYLIKEDEKYILVLSNSNIEDKELESKVVKTNVDDINTSYDANSKVSIRNGIIWTANQYDIVISKVIIRNTIKPKNMVLWFQNFKYLKVVEGIKNIDTSRLTDVSGMFSNCYSLEMLDLSEFDTSGIYDTSGMFANCSNLKVIYVSDKWNLDNVISSDYMFYGNNSLVGGKGTKFDNNHIDKEYAVIDSTNLKGYLTNRE